MNLADKARRLTSEMPRFIMENGAKGVEVIISGKLRAQRAKAMKFRQSDDRRGQGMWVTVFRNPKVF